MKLVDLLLGQPQPIKTAKVVTTKFGKSVLIELEDSVVFLPSRVTETYSPHIGYFGSGKYSLVFRGKVETGKANPAASFEILEN